jgi:hypothetical protein
MYYVLCTSISNELFIFDTDEIKVNKDYNKGLNTLFLIEGFFTDYFGLMYFNYLYANKLQNIKIKNFTLDIKNLL